MFGTVDTWLIWRLTRGEVHVTDVSNASRTMLFNIHTLQLGRGAAELLRHPDVDDARGEVLASEIYGTTKTTIFAHKVPHRGHRRRPAGGDSSDRCAVEPGHGEEHLRHGVLPADEQRGQSPSHRQNNLLTTVAWKIGDKVDYALEGSDLRRRVGRAVAARRAGDHPLRRRRSKPWPAPVHDNGGVYFVPALCRAWRARTGISMPAGAIVGITPRHEQAAHIARAALEGDRVPDAGHRGRHAARLGHARSRS